MDPLHQPAVQLEHLHAKKAGNNRQILMGVGAGRKMDGNINQCALGAGWGQSRLLTDNSPAKLQ